MINIKTFVICLEKTRKERCDVNYPILQNYFSDLNRFTAIDINNIDIDTVIHPLVKATIQNKISDSYYFIQGKGTVGCALSHLECMKICIELNEPIIICEDDISLNDKKFNIIQNSLNHMPNDASFLSLINIPFNKLNYFSKCNYRKYNSYWNRIYGPNFHGLQMYYVTPYGCKIILENSLPIYTQIDQHIGIKLNSVFNFKGYMLSKNIYSTFSFLKDTANTTIGHQNSYKKFLPDNNTFALSIIISFILIIIYYSLNKCRKYLKQKFKFIS